MPARERDCRIDPEKLKLAVRRLDEQLEKARDSAKQLQERNDKYDELRAVLQDLPEKVSHPVMVPFGPLAFFEGHLEHTNEVLVQLSSEWFALKTAKHALGTVDRRVQRLRAEKDAVGREVTDLEERRRLAVAEGAAAGIRPTGERGGDPDGILDIREPCIEEDNARARASGVPGAFVTRDADGYLDIREPEDCEDSKLASTSTASSVPSTLPSRSATASDGVDLARLRELERLEEEEEPPDEMAELDDLLDSYERTGMPPSGSPSSPSSAVVRDDTADAAAVPEIRSPADLYKLMSTADPTAAADAASVERHSSTIPARKAEVSTFAPPDRRVERENAFSGGIKETVAERPQAGVVSSTAATAEPTAPKERVSKFKADRQRAGR